MWERMWRKGNPVHHWWECKMKIVQQFLKKLNMMTIWSSNSTFRYTVDPWTTWVWTARVHLYTDFFLFLMNIYSTTRFAVGWIHRCGTVDTKGQLWELNILGFWYLWQVLDPIPCWYQGMTIYPKEVKAGNGGICTPMFTVLFT